MAEEIATGLVFDKLVFDALRSASQGDNRTAYLKIEKAVEDTGLQTEQILRGIALIRSKGYPVISVLSKRTREDGFRIPQTAREYMEWRDKLVGDLRSIHDVLKISDAAATAQFGTEFAAQPLLF